MPPKSPDTIHILDGKATLFKRPGIPYWHLRYKAEGKWQRVTTKSENLQEAKSIGAEIVFESRFRAKNGLPLVSKRFKAVAKLAIQRMDELLKAGQGKATYKTYIQALNGYLIPFLGNHNIDRIDNVVMRDFEKWRFEQMKRAPAASTLNNHNAALSRVFDEAIERGYMIPIQVPLMRNEGIKTQRRPDFTVDEYVLLHRAMRGWVKDARRGNESSLRLTMRDYVLVLANTGIRAGTEGMNLKWKHVSFFQHKGRKYLALHVNGKTGPREVIARHCVVVYLDRLRRRNPEWATGTFEEFLRRQVDAYVFHVEGKDTNTTFGRMFARLLDKAGLLKDPRSGMERTLYSLRHTYATLMLTLNRLSVYTLAEHMGTSVKMIEDHYGHVQLRKKAREIAGSGGRR